MRRLDIADRLFLMGIPLLIFLLLIFAVVCSVMLAPMERTIVLTASQWRCIEYAPGAVDCTAYRRVGTRAEDVQ